MSCTRVCVFCIYLALHTHKLGTLIRPERVGNHGYIFHECQCTAGHVL